MKEPRVIAIVATVIHIFSPPERPDLELLAIAIEFRYEILLVDPFQLEDPPFLADFPRRSLPLFPNTLADFETLWGLDDFDFEDCGIK